MKVGLFELKVGDRFYLQDYLFELKSYKYKVMPRIGKTLNAVCVNLTNGTDANFTRNLDVEKI